MTPQTTRSTSKADTVLAKPERQVEEENSMYRTILVPLDGSEFGEQALPLALGIARQGDGHQGHGEQPAHEHGSVSFGAKVGPGWAPPATGVTC
jgi:hypothetical protein